MTKAKQVDVEDTKEKICEARYFLDKMKENEGDIRPFRYNLSAFTSAFFSITSFMQKELKKYSGFEEWYDTELLPWMENDSMMRLLYKSRKTTVHIHKIPTRKNVTVHVPAIGTKDKGWAEHEWYFDLHKEIQNIPNVQDAIKVDVITICNTCLKELERRLLAFDKALLKVVC